MTPRPYQTKAAEELQAATVPTLLVAPTGSGKTVIAAQAICSFVARGRRVLFLAHRREILDQTQEKLFEAGLSRKYVGRISAGINTPRDVTVASIDSLRRRKSLPPCADVVVIDEAHRALSKSYRALIAAYPGATVLGLTATPLRRDGRPLGDVFKAMLEASRPSQLIADGWIADPDVWTAPPDKLPEMTGIGVAGGDYEAAALEERVNTRALVGSIVDHWKKHAGKRRTVVFAAGIHHSLAIVESFKAAGVTKVEHLDGSTSSSERAKLLKRFRDGKVDIISNCNVLQEGWDEPSCKCIVMARPTLSLTLWLQSVGRCMRPWEGVKPVVLDHAGNAEWLGLPGQDRAYSLTTGHRHRTGRDRPQAKRCPTCMFTMPVDVGMCAKCGFSFPAPEASPGPSVVDGELQVARVLTEDDRRQLLEDLCESAIRGGLTGSRVIRSYIARTSEAIPPGWMSTVERVDEAKRTRKS